MKLSFHICFVCFIFYTLFVEVYLNIGMPFFDLHFFYKKPSARPSTIIGHILALKVSFFNEKSSIESKAKCKSTVL